MWATCRFHIAPKVYISWLPFFFMVEPDLEESLQRLRQSLARIKALVAWEQLKHGEAGPNRIAPFQMQDPTHEDLRNEYAFLLAAIMNTHSIINDHSSSIAQTVRTDFRCQLAEIERQLRGLQLYRRFGGPGG